jgi:hypothetical protein
MAIAEKDAPFGRVATAVEHQPLGIERGREGQLLVLDQVTLGKRLGRRRET